ncbi:hypothetical protein [Mycobacterium gordonae]
MGLLTRPTAVPMIVDMLARC